MADWISVEDRLPKIGESVLVAVIINAKVSLPFHTESAPEIRIGWRDNLSARHKWCLQFSNADMAEVTHWQPLPELPKED